jgi:peptide/nickel transport system permease protein
VTSGSAAIETVGSGARRRRPTRALLRSAIRAWGRSRDLRLGLGLLTAMLVGSVVASFVMPAANEQDLTSSLAAPGTVGHPLGADALGRDIFAWCGGGIRTAVLVGVLVVLLASAIGVVIGALAGYIGGWFDSLLMRLVDLQLAIPPILVAIAAAAVLEITLTSLVLLLALTSWMPYARIVRTKVQSERERAHIAAARLAGSGPLRILFWHLVPSVGSIVLVMASLQAGYMMLAESGLSFLGFGLNPPDVSLGYMVQQGKDQLTSAWWISAIPGLCLVALVFAFNLIGDGLRDLFDVNQEVDR